MACYLGRTCFSPSCCFVQDDVDEELAAYEDIAQAQKAMSLLGGIL